MKNAEVIQVGLWDRVVGYLAIRGGTVAFEYEPRFKTSAFEIAPVEMPLATTTVYSSRELNNTFHGLPGVIADCLPDFYGMRAIEGFFKKHFGVDPPSLGILDRLLYLGRRSMGALEFRPAIDDVPLHDEFLQLKAVVHAARKTLAGEAADVMADLLRISASTGGRQAKALVDFHPGTGELRSGFAAPTAGFHACILKLDGTREGDPPNVYGRLEHVYALMAKACGIAMPRTYLLEGDSEDGPVAHFLVERFDRHPDKTKPFHYGSLCGLLLRDYRAKHSCSYEQYFALTRHLAAEAAQVEEAYRRAVFNIVCRNQDDHPKNFGFLMDQTGTWQLAPAFDLTYVYGLGMSSTHQMTLGAKDDDFSVDDLLHAAKASGLSRPKAQTIIEGVVAAARGFPALAAEHGLDDLFARGILNRFRLFDRL
jgi:serine/threonine-protein kinase HipA